MPPLNERVAVMVRRELAKNPTVGNDVLLEKARAIDARAVRRLSPRQFNATYRLPAVRRAKAAAASTASSSASTNGAGARSTRAADNGRATPAAAAEARSAAPSASDSSPATAVASASPPPASEPAAAIAPAAPSTSSTSTALTRPHAAEREAVRQILQLVAREALASEDRASFIRLLDSLDERAAVILGLFRRV